MHPRTVAILAASILLLALGMRVVVYQTGLLPVSEELILKQAIALTVTYSSEGKAKTLFVNRPEQLQALFAVLDLRPAGERPTTQDLKVWPVATGVLPIAPSVTFHFPDGSRRQMYFQGQNWLEDFGVNPRFYAKLCEYASRAEGRPVQLLHDDRWPQEGDHAP
jgi:hypothetical protein